MRNWLSLDGPRVHPKKLHTGIIFGGRLANMYAYQHLYIKSQNNPYFLTEDFPRNNGKHNCLYC